MIKINKKVLFPAIGLAVLAFATLGANTFTFAQQESDPESALVEKISTKFNLNKVEVQKVFDEQKTEMHKQMLIKHEERLNMLVTEGKITEAQKALIINKHKELFEERELNRKSNKNLSPEEKKAKMTAKKAEIEAWAKENDIDPSYLFLGKGMKNGFNHKGL